VNRDGTVQDIKKILVVDSVAAAVGGLFGASSITTYVESAAGVAEGGRTGLMPIVTGLCFAVAAFFTPLIRMIGGGITIPAGEQYRLLADAGFAVPESGYTVMPITAGALIFVGYLMIKAVREIEWERFDEAFPSFLIIVAIPLTSSISHGIGLGFILFTLIKLIRGRIREVHPLMIAVAAAFVVFFALETI